MPKLRAKKAAKRKAPKKRVARKRSAAVRKSRTRASARKATASVRKKLSTKKSARRYLIEALSITGRMKIKYFFWTGKSFSDVKNRSKKFGSSQEAWKVARSMVQQLPKEIRTLRVVPA